MATEQDGIASNLINGTDQSEEIYGNGGDDTIYALSGDDTVEGGDGNDLIYGQDGNDSLSGGAGNDTICGENGSDWDYYATGNDTISGGTGNDLLLGDRGDNTYIFNIGDGNDTINEGINSYSYYYGGGNDTVKLNGINQGDVIFTAQDYNLIVRVKSSDDSITIIDQYYDDSLKIENFVFDDGTLTFDQVAGMLQTFGTDDNDVLNGSVTGDAIYGYAGDDTIYAASGDDTVEGGDGNDLIYGQDDDDSLSGGAGDDTIYGEDGSDWDYYATGNDTISGGTGNDSLLGDRGDNTYIFNIGDGNDTISESINSYSYYYGGGNDTVKFNGINQDDVIFTSQDYNLIIKVKGSDDSITIINQLYNDYRTVENFVFDDSTLTFDQVAGMLQTFGTDDNDVLNGSVMGDAIYGYLGDDTIYAAAGNDTVYGGDGNDAISGGDGNDTIFGGTGNDSLQGQDGNDVIQGENGNDTIYGGYGDDAIQGEDNDDIIYGGYGNDSLSGGAGDDTIYGEDGSDWDYYATGNDTISGGTGNDLLSGDRGENTYIFNIGDGNDTINESTNWESYYNGGGNDTIKFGQGITLDMLSFSASATDLIISINGTEDKLTIQNQLYKDNRMVENFVFDDGTSQTILPYSVIQSMLSPTVGTDNSEVINGSDVCDKIYGYGGDDTIYALSSDDTVYGGDGNDFLSTSDGNDLLYGDDGDDTVYGEYGNDTMYGGSGNDLIAGWYGNDILQGDSGNDTLWGEEDNDTLIGGTGNDLLAGNTGDDTYIFNIGDGQDTIDESSYKSPDGNDTLKFGPGITFDMLSFSASAMDLVISINGTEDKLTIQNQLYKDNRMVENFVFDDGTILPYSAIESLLPPIVGTDNDEVINGSDVCNKIYGNGGDDTIYALSSDDTVDGGDGNDSIYGGDGNDTITGNMGDDTLIGEAGDDYLNDYNGINTYIFNFGDGNDTIDAYNFNGQTIKLGDGIKPTDISFVNTINNLKINIGDGSILLTNYNPSDTDLNYIEFSDGSRFTLKTAFPLSQIILSNGNIFDITKDENPNHRYEYKIDANNLIYAKKEYDKDNNLIAEYQYHYDSEGQQNILGSYSISLNEYQNGMLTAFMYEKYDNSAQLTKKERDIYINGNELHDYYIEYDDNGNINKYEKYEPVYDSHNSLSYYWIKDQDGNQTGKLTINTNFNEGIRTETESYLYFEDEDEVLKEQDILTYNESGNLLKEENYYISESTGLLTLDSTDTYTYDANGNILSKENLWIDHNNDNYQSLYKITYKYNDSEKLVSALEEWNNYNTGQLDSGSANIMYQYNNDILTAEVRSSIDNTWSQIYIYRSDIDGISNLIGQDSNNILVGNDFSNFITGSSNSNAIYGQDGNDTIIGEEGNDIIYGGYGNDSLSGGAGDDTIYGENGSPDWDYAPGNDTISGGTGNDSLLGDIGDNTYIFNIGDGHDTISENNDWESYYYGGGNDTVKFGQGITLDMLSFSVSATDLVISINGTEDKLTIQNQLYNDYRMVENFVFGDGTSQITLTYSDIQSMLPPIIGTDNSEVINGSIINDIIYGNVGDDTIYALSGNDTIEGRDGNDYLEGNSGDDSISGDAGNDTIYGGDGSDVIQGGDGNDTIYGEDYNDTISGGAGNDYLAGGTSDDIYLFNIGDGADTIADGYAEYWNDGTDTIKFGEGIAKDDLIFRSEGNNLIITFKNSDDKLTLQNHLAYANIEKLEFADGTFLSNSEFNLLAENKGTPDNDSLAGSIIADKIYGYEGDDTISASGGDDTILAGSGNDNIYGDYGNDSIIGEEGNDSIYGQDGGDTIYGGDGNDSIYGGYGNDSLSGGAGDDTIYGENGSSGWDYAPGSDTISGGTGNDSLLGDIGDNIYIFNIGDGNDTISESTNWESYYYGGGNDTVKFGQGITLDMLSFNVAGADLVISFNGTEDKLTIQNQLYNDYRIVENFVFDDGTSQITLTYSDIQPMLPPIIGTDNSEVINGSILNDTISGNGGDDTIYALSGNDTIEGGDGNDSIYAGTGDDSVLGNLGNDTIYGDDGNDVIQGKDGDDTIYGEGDNDTISGGAGNDYLEGNWGDDYISGDAGNDTIYGGYGNDSLSGGDDNDTIYGESDNDTISGEAGNDIIYGGDGYDVIQGGEGDDTIYGESYNDTISGGTGNDYLEGGWDDDTYLFNIGDGSDTILDGYYYYSNAGTDTVKFGEGITKDDLMFRGDGSNLIITFKNSDDKLTLINHLTYANIEKLEFADGSFLLNTDFNLLLETRGTTENDSLTGSIIADKMYGYEGDDTISASSGNDIIYAGSGNDTIYGEDDNDFIDGEDGNDIIYASTGDDSILGNLGNDTIYGGDGNDSLSGGAGDDTIYGENGSNWDYYATGSDTISGGTGNDLLLGDRGDNTYIFNIGDGNDTISESINSYSYYYDGGGNDTVKLNGINQDDVIFTTQDYNLIIKVKGSDDSIIIQNQLYNDYRTVENFVFDDGTLTFNQITGMLQTFGTDNNDVLNGSIMDDAIYGYAGDDTIYAASGNDTIYGGDDNDSISGGDGNDTIFGGTGNDSLQGQDGNDVIQGENGNDTIYGGYGNDSLSGGGGDDTIYGEDGSNWDYYATDSDTISGDTGNDLLLGDRGDNTYIFNIGDGNDTINEGINEAYGYGGGNDTVKLNGINQGDVIFTTQDYNLIVKVKDSDNSITIINQLYNDNRTVENFVFDDGILTFDQVAGMLQTFGTDENDVLNGSVMSDAIYGYAGDDTIYAASGNDTVYGGDGNDIIYGGAGNDSLSGGDGNDTIYAESQNDTVSGGAGNDYLEGGWDDDTYLFNIGDDSDTISDNYYEYSNAGTDTIKFGEGITKDNLIFSSDGNNLIITFKNSPDDKLTLINHLTYANIEKLEFADGTFLLNSDFNNMISIQGSDGNDNIIGTDNSDSIYGLSGDDTIYSRNGDDTIYGGSGNDLINTGAGDKLIFGDDGNDTIFGNYGDDTIYGGSGNDSLNGASGNNTYLFDIGDGNDTISDSQGNDVSSDIDTVKFTGSIAVNDINVRLDNNDLIITIKNTGDSLRLLDQNNPDSRIENFVFSDGTTLSYNDIVDISTPLLSFSTSSFIVNEDGTCTIPVTVKRIGGSHGEVSATINLTDDTALSPSDYLTNPITVTFADGDMSDKVINIPIIDDTAAEGQESFNLSLINPTGGAELGSQNTAKVYITDNDVQLNFSAADYSVREDGTAITDIIVTRSGCTTGEVSTTISFTNGTAIGCSCPPNVVTYDYYNRGYTITFADGETSKVLHVEDAKLGGSNAIRIRNDAKVEGNEYFTINLTNPTGGATIGDQGSAKITIIDDDVALAFSSPTFSIREDGQAIAAVTINRTGRMSGIVGAAINLTDSTATYPDDYSKLSVDFSMADGESSKVIEIPVKLDTIIEPDETITLSLANPTGGAIIGTQNTATLTIIDSGIIPVLTITFDKDRISEDIANSVAHGTITRNIVNDQDLVVTLVSSDASHATVPTQVIIPANKASVNFDINAVDDQLTSGNHAVTITASADTYKNGSKVITVTDINVPDIVVSELSTSTSLFTEKQAYFTYKVKNNGIAAAVINSQTPLIDRIYLSTDATLDSSDTLLNTFTFKGTTLPVNQGYERTVPFYAPKTPGTYYLIAQTDIINGIDEGATDGESNNTTVIPVHIAPAYHATVSADKDVSLTGNSITLYGQATSNADSSPAAYEFVTIAVKNSQGITREISAFTDGNGNFSRVFTPSSDESGLYQINAYYPGYSQEDSAPEDTFKIIGMSFASNQISIDLPADQVYTGQVELDNSTDIPLEGITCDVLGVPADWDVQVEAPTRLDGSGKSIVKYSIKAPNTSQVTNDIFDIRLTSTEGATVDLPVNVNLKQRLPHLVNLSGDLSGGMLRGTQTFIEFTVTNDGADIANNIQVKLPNVDWLKLVSSSVISSLVPGESTKVTLQLSPDADLPLTYYNGSLVLDVEGNNGDLSVPFSFRAVSDNKGKLQVKVSDELTYYSEGSPMLSGATIRLTDAYTGQEITTLTTDETGIVTIDSLQEGYYTLEVSADDHSIWTNNILIKAGVTDIEDTFLSRQAVKYYWSVTPTEIQDQYDITLQSTYETNVPVPTIVFDPPQIDLNNLITIGQVMQVNLTATNYGLIAANDIKLEFGNSLFYKFEPLVDSIDSIDAHGSITIPVKITRIADANSLNENSQTGELVTSEMQTESELSGPCIPRLSFIYDYECAGKKIEYAIPIPVINFDGNCDHPASPGYNFELTIRPFDIPSGYVPPVVDRRKPETIIPDVCNPCIEKIKQYAAFLLITGLTAEAGPLIGWGLYVYGLVADGYRIVNDPSYDVTDPWSIGGLISDTVGNPLVDDKIKLKNLGKNLGTKFQIVYKTLNLIKDMTECIKDGMKESDLSISSTGSLNDAILQLAQYGNRLQTALNNMQAFFGDKVWLSIEDDVTFSEWFGSFADKIHGNSLEEDKISDTERTELLNMTIPSPLTGSDINKFIDRWNRTIDYNIAGIYNTTDVPNGQSLDFLALDQLKAAGDALSAANQQSQAEGYQDIIDGLIKTSDQVNAAVDASNNDGACAKITMQISQSAVMTRSAFIGTLDLTNRNHSAILNHIAVTLQIKDMQGNIETGLFGITSPTLNSITAVDGTGILNADTEGTAKWTFIPTNLAATTTPTQYSIGGTLSYDENGEHVVVPLLTTPVTVYPQAELHLDYFQQRNVYADDPFTDKIEPSVPYTLGVMVRNDGYGTAKNLIITSAQPKIVENEKGLLMDFQIIGSSVNGSSITPSLTVDFGDIAPGKTEVADWQLKSPLQGKFTDYQATFQHVNDLGMQELSLIKDVNIHELVKEVKADGDNLPDFLVNDVFDTNFDPDNLYLSDGTKVPVQVITDATANQSATLDQLQVQITATTHNGWSYIKLTDPGDGQFQIKKILRADGTEINLNNVWITDRTFPATGSPTYENILHILDNTTDGSQTYTVIYTSGDQSAPKVQQIADVIPSIRTTPVNSVEVVFTEALKNDSFDVSDISLTLDGEQLNTSSLTISKIDATHYVIGNLSDITGNIGQYKLGVNAAGVQDLEGNTGEGIVTENWTFSGERPAVTTVSGFTSNHLKTPVDTVTVTFSRPLSPDSFDTSDLFLNRDDGGNLINQDITITQINDTSYQINNLAALTAIDGSYNFMVDAKGVKDTDGNTGIGGGGYTWTLDTTSPSIVSITDTNGFRNSKISTLDITFSEPIDSHSFTINNLTLTQDHQTNLINDKVTLTKLNDTTYRIDGLASLQTSDGNYEFAVNGNSIKDKFGNALANNISKSWTLDTVAPDVPTNIQVSANHNTSELSLSSLGTLNQYGQIKVNSTSINIMGTLDESNLHVYIRDANYNQILAQANITGTTFNSTVDFSTPGTKNLKIEVVDQAGNSTSEELNLFIDNISPTVQTFKNVPQLPVLTPISSIEVDFSENIDPSTFDINDLILTRNSNSTNLITNAVSIEQISGSAYRINGLANVASASGTYTLTVNTTGIQDTAGNNGTNSSNAVYTIQSPPTPGLTFAQSSGSTQVTEGGNSDSYSVILNTKPSADVILNISQDAQLQTNKTTLTFTADNWNIPQTVTVTAVDNNITDGTRTAAIHHTVSSTDTNYNSLTLQDINATINDNDAEIHGTIWQDINRNGVHDPSEPNLSNWKVFLDTNQNGVLDTGERSTLTGQDGSYEFAGLLSGSYSVALECQDGWQQTYPSGTLSTDILTTTTSSEILMYSPTESAEVLPNGTYSTPSIDKSEDLINLTQFRSDPNFSGITGKDFSIVVIDTGIDEDSPFFGTDADQNGIADRIVYQYDFADDTLYATDINSHGSHVASIAASVAPEANIIALKVFQNNGSGKFAYLEKALQWVISNADKYNIASVNLSLGDGLNWQTEASRYGIGDELAALAAKNIMIAAASGNGYYTFNSTPGLSYPAADPNVIPVGAVWNGDNGGTWHFSNGATDYTTGSDQITSFSQRDPDSQEIFAPGATITAANSTGGTQTMQGTSQAAPWISGIAALAQQLAVQSLGRRLTLKEFQDLLSSTGTPIVDGDDENDNVTNTGATYSRVNVESLANGILALNNSSANNGSSGNTNSGENSSNAVPASISASHSVTVNGGQVLTGIDFGVQTINKLPVIAVNQGLTLIESETKTLSTSDLQVTDQDNTSGQITYKLTSLPAHGAIYRNTTLLTENSTFTQADIDSGIISYTHDGSYTLSDSFNFTVSDGYGGNISSTAFNITVTPIHITGTSGNDTINGNSLNNVLDGGAGADTMLGNLGNDTYIIDDPYDTVSEKEGEGNDTINSSITYTLPENVENLILTGLNSVNGYGNGSNNIIQGNSENNSLFGGTGNDTLYGGNGNDTYLFNKNDGQDTLLDLQGSDILQFGDGILKDDILTTRSGNDLLVTINGSTDSITIQNWFTSDDYKIEQFKFANGTDTLNNSDILLAIKDDSTGIIESTGYENNEIIGSDLNNDIREYHGNDEFFTGGGNDSIIDYEGNDTIYSGEGKDAIYDMLGDDFIDAGSGDDEIFDKNGNDTINSGSGNDCIYEYKGNDLIYGGEGNDTINDYQGNDTISGGKGNDKITDTSGNDTYLFEKGDGIDTVYNLGFVTDTNDKVLFGTDINKNDISFFKKSNGDLIVSYSNSDNFTLIFQQNPKYIVEKFELEDGSYITAAQVNEIVQEMSTFAVNNKISYTGVQDSRNEQLMQIVASYTWNN